MFGGGCLRAIGGGLLGSEVSSFAGFRAWDCQSVAKSQLICKKMVEAS